MLKVGIGQDLHRLEAGGPLILGGVKVESNLQANAHSDGDALVHAIIDALITPVNGQNVGTLFPDNDPQYKSADSLKLLGQIKQDYLGNVTIQNMDCVIILDQPKLASVIPVMCANIADVLGLETHQVTIKAKTSEKTAPDCVQATVITLLDVK